jgi:hypothetical protein
MVSEISTHSPCHYLRAHGEEEYQGSEMWYSKTAHLVVGRRQREQKGQGQDMVPKGISPMTYFLQLDIFCMLPEPLKIILPSWD